MERWGFQLFWNFINQWYQELDLDVNGGGACHARQLFRTTLAPLENQITAFLKVNLAIPWQCVINDLSFTGK